MSVIDPYDRTDVINQSSIDRLAATLDVDLPAGLPPLWHWVSFLDSSPTATLGADGHPRQGGLIPNPPHPRRMFAGGRMRWASSLPVDTPIRRTSSVGQILHKSGSRGPLAFATVEMKYAVDGQLLAVEAQDLVYLPDSPRQQGSPTKPVEPENQPEAHLFAEATFTEATLFRFSALTFNSHRIHYDLSYARDTEGYSGLVVHGPLLIVRLLDLVRGAYGEDAIEELAFRAVAPAFCGEVVRFFGWRSGLDVRLEAASGEKPLLKADVRLRPETI